MFFYSAVLFAGIILLLTVTTKVEAEGVSIPLTKRSSLTKEDGTFDHEKAIIQTAAIKIKHSQNLNNLARNKALEASNEVKPFPIVPRARKPPHGLGRESEPLIEEAGGSEWAGYLSIGTPAQKFLIDFDTGSSDFWVPSSSCTMDVCKSKNKYDASLSKTGLQKPGTFSILYGDNSTVSGPILEDMVDVSGITASQQLFSSVTTLSDTFNDQPIDGVLGLAFPELSYLQGDPFFFNAMKQRAVFRAEFSFKLTSGTGSSLFLGGRNYLLFVGFPEFHALSSPRIGFWQISGASIFVGSSEAASDFDTIIDSGTTIIYGPSSVVGTFYSKIPGATLYDSKNGYYSFPCSADPTISFSWNGGRKWYINSSNFNLGSVTPGSPQCIGAIATQDFGFGPNVWLVGDSFMKNVYTIFSVEQYSIGFATLA